MKIIPYGRQDIDKTDINEVVKVLKSDWITQGPKIEELESRLAKHSGARYAVCVSSGTAALHLAGLAAGLKKGDEVITTPVTFVATANAILYAGAKPVFADIDSETINIDPEQIKKKITKKTKVILPVHFAGLPCDMEEIASIAKKNEFIVIEDACHALGAQYKYMGRWIKTGSCRHSDMTIFSFHPVKSITTGEGGAILTNRRDFYERLLMLRHHGITKKNLPFRGPWYYEMQYLGFNYRITDIQCALGISQLKKLDGFIKKRREIVNIYNKELSRDKALILPKEPPYAKSSWHIYPIRLKDSLKRKRVFNRLRKSGIGAQVHYIPVHLQPYYKKNLGYKEGDYPQAERYYRSTITLPLYPGMSETEVRYVIKTLERSL